MRKYKIKRQYVGFGKLLQDARIKRGLTQRQVANLLKYTTPQHISNFERGILRPPLKKLAFLINLYDMNTNTVIAKLLECRKEVLTKSLA